MDKLGRYEILTRIAVGGMAEILLGRITGPSGFERPVVLKRVLPHLALQPAFVDMFLDEAEITAGIRHPNVAQVHELGSDGEELFLVMEYLEGESALGLLRRLHSAGEKLPPALAAFVVAEACAGLHAAHELAGADGQPRELVHRDVSPQNIFVTYEGMVKLLDFGIAKAADRITATQAGDVKGKFAYMSPEQSRAEPLDRRSDIFAMGIVLYELLTGHSLFRRANEPLTMHAVCNAEVVFPAGFGSAALKALCLRCLKPNPTERPATALELREQLLAIVAAEPSPGALPGPALAALMSRLFGERAAAKRQALRQARSGAVLDHMPPAEADGDVLLPSATALDLASDDIEVAPESNPQPASGRRSSKTAAVVLAAAAVMAVVTAIVVPRLGPSDGDSTPAPHAQDVRLQLQSTPAGAEVRVQGVLRGHTPVDLMVPRGNSPIRIVLSSEGYETLNERVTPNADQRLRLSLVKLPPAPVTIVSAAASTTASATAPDKTRRATAVPPLRSPPPNPPASAPTAAGSSNPWRKW